MWWKPWASVKDWREAGVPERRVTGSTFFKWQDWIRVQGGASESSAQSRTWREPVRKKIAFNCLKWTFSFPEASPSYNTCERSPVQARCSTVNICRAIKVINVGFCYCFLIAKTEEQQKALQFEMESAFVATKYWGTYEYIYETQPALPIYSFSFLFFLATLSWVPVWAEMAAPYAETPSQTIQQHSREGGTLLHRAIMLFPDFHWQIECSRHCQLTAGKHSNRRRVRGGESCILHGPIVQAALAKWCIYYQQN